MQEVDDGIAARCVETGREVDEAASWSPREAAVRSWPPPGSTRAARTLPQIRAVRGNRGSCRAAQGYNYALMIAARLPAPARFLAALVAIAFFTAVGLVGAFRYVDNYWLYRGFAPPETPHS